MPEHDCEDEPRVKCCANPACGHVLGKTVIRPDKLYAEYLFLAGTDIPAEEGKGFCPRCGTPWYHTPNSVSTLVKNLEIQIKKGGLRILQK
jgi:hypothetical protein